jgi:soluble lytic murein transglycosylase-like protein
MGVFALAVVLLNPDMRTRLQLALMAVTVIATFFLFTPNVHAQSNSGTASITTTTDGDGHTVYVNDGTPKPHLQRTANRSRSSLVYWSTTQHRWKPVPRANEQAARSAAAEVDQFFGSANRSPQFSNASTRQFTQSQIDDAIEQAAARHNVDPNLVRAVVKVESNFNPNAVSRKGAMGLMQLMPQTARQLKVANPFDPQQNIDAGVRHLKQLMESYGGNVRLSLAAYNAGAGAVARSAGVPHIAETRNYVKRITELYYGGAAASDVELLGGPAHDPIRVERDSRGVLYISNTD